MFDENAIIKRLADPKTQRKAFEEVVRHYSEKLYWQIRRMVMCHDDANDILQNVFIKVWKNLDSFRSDSKLSTWLYRIAMNESLDFLRKQHAALSVSGIDDPEVVANLLRADEYFDGDEIQIELQQAISQLPPTQRTVFNLRYFDEMKYSEMSKVLKTSEGALKASYHIAVQKISKFFKDRD